LYCKPSFEDEHFVKCSSPKTSLQQEQRLLPTLLPLGLYLEIRGPQVKLINGNLLDLRNGFSKPVGQCYKVKEEVIPP
jgi:hypothetical protein